MTSIPDLSRGAYTVREIAEIAGVNRSVIGDWINRGIITAPPSPGHGRTWELPLRCAVQAMIAVNLNNFGLRAGTVASIMNQVTFFHIENTRNNDHRPEALVIVLKIHADGRAQGSYRKVDGDSSGPSGKTAIEITIDLFDFIQKTTKALSR